MNYNVTFTQLRPNRQARTIVMKWIRGGSRIFYKGRRGNGELTWGFNSIFWRKVGGGVARPSWIRPCEWHLLRGWSFCLIGYCQELNCLEVRTQTAHLWGHRYFLGLQIILCYNESFRVERSNFYNLKIHGQKLLPLHCKLLSIFGIPSCPNCVMIINS